MAHCIFNTLSQHLNMLMDELMTHPPPGVPSSIIPINIDVN